MKEKAVRKVTAAAEVMSGSPTTLGRDVDVSLLYIDMLCEKFKNRGIKTGFSATDDVQKRKKNSERIRKLGLNVGKTFVSADSEKYKSLNINGKSYMSSDDFAAYYKDLRDYKLPRFYSRAESEYESAEAMAMANENVQESGKSPKKAKWLAITKHAKNKIKKIPSHINKEEFTAFAEEWFLFDKTQEEVEGQRRKFPTGILPVFIAVTLSLLLIVCSSVMVSRASASVSLLEDKLEELDYIKNDLEGKLNVKNDMLDIKNIAIEEYGMISADYATSKYIDIKEDEKLVRPDSEKNDESWLSQLLKAIGLKED